VRGVREVDDLHAHIGEIALELIPHVGALPIVTDEHDIEPVLLPGRHLVRRRLGHYLVDVADALNDLHPLDFWYDRRLVLSIEAHRVRRDADDQVIAQSLRAAQHVQMTNVKHVEHAGRVADPESHQSPVGGDTPHRAVARTAS